MYKLLVSSFFSLFCLYTLAQASDTEVEWGPLLKTRDIHFNQVAGVNETHFYTVGNSKMRGIFSTADKFYVRKYELGTYKLVYELFVDDFKYRERDAELIDFRLINEEVHLFFRVFQGKEDKKYLLRRVVDKRGKLSKVELVTKIPATKRSGGSFSFHYSEDSTKVLVFSGYPYEKKEVERFGILVLDTTFLELWDETVALPYADKYFSVIDQCVTNEGDVFMLGYASPDRNKGQKRNRNSSNQDYKLFRISKDSEDILEFDLDLDDKYITGANIRADFGDGLMAVAGFYSEKEVGDIAGSFYITIDQKKLEAVTANSEAFSKAFMANFMSERKVEKGRELISFRFRDFIRRSDGGTVAVAEQYQRKVVTNQIPNGPITTTVYYLYNDIIVININPDGEIDWTAHIPKYQTSTDDGGFFLSYLLVVNGDKLHFIFNDNPKNLKRLAEGKRQRSMGSPSKSMAIVATVDGNGEVVRDKLFNSKEVSAILIPKLSKQTETNEALLYGIKKRNSRFGRLRLD